MKSKFLSKKLLVWLLAVMMIVASMTGCGGKEDDDEDKDSKSRKEQSVDDEEEEEEEAVEGETTVKEDQDSEVVDSKEDEDAEEKVVEEDGEAYDVVLKMVEACQGKMMTRSSMDMDLEMSIGVEGFFIDMDMNITGETLASADPFISYSDLVLNMNAMGENIVETTKSYTVVEDGKMITYSYAGSEDQWHKEDMGIDAATMLEQQNVSYEFLLGKAEEDYVLDSTLHNMNGRDAYKLSFTLTAAELQNTMNSMAGMEDLMAEAGMEDLDMSALAVPTVYYVDAETYQIVGMEMSVEGMDEMLGAAMDELMAAESDEYSMSFEIGECKMIFSNISYEPVEIPALPAEVLAMQNGTDDVETEAEVGFSEEVYTIIKDTIIVTVECPEEWEVSDMQGDYVTFQNADATQAVCYNLYDVSGREVFVDYVENTEVAGTIDSGRYVSHGEGPVIGEFETMYLDCTDFDFYYAWAPVGDMWMLVTIADMNGEDMNTILNDMLAMIVEVNA